MAGIYLRVGSDAPLGPLAEEEVRRRLASGELPGSAMSWRQGEPRWQSLSRRWPAAPRTRWAVSVRVLGCGVLAAFAVGMATEWLPGLPYALRRFEVSTALSLAALVAAIVLAVGAWRASRRSLGRTGPAAAASALLVSMVVLCTLPMVGLNKRLHDERLASGNATFTFDHRAGALRIAGDIGDRFVPDLRAALARHPRTGMVTIDSPGGFVDDAFEAGRILRAHGLRVRVDGECASACVIVWSSAASREASVGARFGLHQSYAEGDVPAAWLADARDASNADTVALLRGIGFDAALLAARDKAGADGMHWVGPIELQEAGVRLSLVDSGGARVSMPQARVLHVLSRNQGTMRVAEAYARARVDGFERLGGGIHQAWRDDDAVGLFRATAELVEAARAHALANAPDAAVVAWARRMRELLEAPVAGSDRLACAVLVDGAQAVRKRDDRLRDRAHAALAGLLAAATAKAPVPPRGAPVPQGYDAWPAQRKCSHLHRLYGELVERPVAEAAAAIRATGPNWR